MTNPVPAVALDQIHIGPTDDVIEHTMSAFCPCGPTLTVGNAEGDGDTAQVITYRHNKVGDP